MNRKRFGLILILGCLLVLLLAGISLADGVRDALSFQLEFDTTKLDEPKPVTVSLTVTNRGDSDLPGPIMLYYPDQQPIEEFGSPVLKAGSSKNWTGIWTVTQKQLEAGKITFIAHYTDYDENGELETRAIGITKRIKYVGQEIAATEEPVVTATPAEPIALRVEVEADRDHVTRIPGGVVRFTIRVYNDSTADVSDIRIRAGNTTVYTFSTIPAGESRSFTRDMEISMPGSFRFTAEAKDYLGQTVSFESNTVPIEYREPAPEPAPLPEVTPEPPAYPIPGENDPATEEPRPAEYAFPDSCGYRVDLSIADMVYSAELQQDNGITEINLGGFGVVQLADGKLIYANGGAPLVVDFSGLISTIQQIGSGGGGEQLFGMIGEKAVQYMLMPFIEYSMTGETFSLHLDASSEQLAGQLRLFLNDLAGNEQVRSAYPAISGVLRIAIPGFPENVEAFPDYVLSMISTDRDDQWRVEGDLRITMEGQRVTEFILSGNYHHYNERWGGIYPVYLEYSLVNGVPVIHADVNIPSGGASLHLDTNDVRFELREYARMRDLRYETTVFAMDGTYNRTTGALNTVIRSGSGKEVGQVQGIILPDLLELNIRYYDDVIDIYLRKGKDTVYGKARVAAYAVSFDYDLWIENEPEGIRIRLSGWNGGRGTDEYYSLQAGRNRFNLEIYPDGETNPETGLHVSAVYTPDTRGIDISGELRYRGIPYRARLTGTSPEYQLAFSYSYYDWDIEGNGTIRFAPDGLPEYARCTVATSGRNGSGYTNQKEYVLQRLRTENSLTYQLTEDAAMLYQLDLLQNETEFGKAYTVRLLGQTGSIFSLSVTPVQKQAVIPIDTGSAIVMTPDMLVNLLRTMVMLP